MLDIDIERDIDIDIDIDKGNRWYIYIYTFTYSRSCTCTQERVWYWYRCIYECTYTCLYIQIHTHTHLLNSDFILHTCCICFFWTSPATLDIGIHVPGSGTPPPPVNHFWGRVYTMHDTLHVHDMFTLIHISHCATPWLTTCLHTAAKRCSLPQGWPQVF
jgi:hypothetical protein